MLTERSRSFERPSANRLRRNETLRLVDLGGFTPRGAVTFEGPTLYTRALAPGPKIAGSLDSAACNLQSELSLASSNPIVAASRGPNRLHPDVD